MNTQMNVRMDAQLKQVGDKAFANAGLTPSQVVRSVWEFGARHIDEPHIIRQAFASKLDLVEKLELDCDIAHIEQATSICSRLREQFGLKAPDHLEELDYRALREEAATERLAERSI